MRVKTSTEGHCSGKIVIKNPQEQREIKREATWTKQSQRRQIFTLIGIVICDKMIKTVSVLVERLTRILRTKKFILEKKEFKPMMNEYLSFLR
jgi:hypothetical protein